MYTIVYDKSARDIFWNLCGRQKDHLELTKEKLIEDSFRHSEPLKGKGYKGVRSPRFGRHRILLKVDAEMFQVAIVGGDDRRHVYTQLYNYVCDLRRSLSPPRHYRY
ncbi:hypothetical protein TNIN_260161 [Trichonephila inaurata madagascariensis]|uniref:Uncharacterized protein n=1 Tax=Trichonephila inaurata madagascariensis TaxID=2747483 RepID=A0A8X6YDE4_9ARAC|nr:hypothetical protein TNIN_260161 [Trichonephila inaurata madagascariensis]